MPGYFEVKSQGFKAYCDALIARHVPYEPSEAFLVSLIGTPTQIDAIGASLFQKKPVGLVHQTSGENFDLILGKDFASSSIAKKTDNLIHKVIRSDKHFNRKASWLDEKVLFGTVYGVDLEATKQRAFLLVDSQTNTPLLPQWIDWLWDEVFHPEKLFSFGNENFREAWNISWPEEVDFEAMVLDGVRAGYLTSDVSSARFVSLPPADLDAEPLKVEPKEISIGDFLNDWGDQLKAKVIEGMAPVYAPKQEDDWDKAARVKLDGLLRKPFPGQTIKGVLPVAKAFYQENQKGIFNVGVMGTGKTQMALSVAHLDPRKSKRILVMCPGHLVQKWIREAKAILPDVTCHNLNGPNMDLLIAHKLKPAKPKGVEVWVIGKERGKLHYQRKVETYFRKGQECCPDCGRRVDYDDNDAAPKCKNDDGLGGCGNPLWGADNTKYRRYAKGEFIKRYLPNNFFDLVILDEIHELSNESAQGQAMAAMVTKSKRILALTGTLMGGYSRNLYYLLYRMFPKQMKELGFEYGRTLQFAKRYGIVETTFTEKKEGASSNVASIGRKTSKPTSKEVPGISPALLPDLLLEHSVFVRLSDVADQLPEYDEIVSSVPMLPDQEREYNDLSDTLTKACKEALAKGDMRLMGKMLQSLLAYPDGCRKEEIVTLEVNGREEVVAYAPALDFKLLPKEELLLEILETEKKQGRKVAIFLEHTGTRDLIPTLSSKLLAKGFAPLILRSDAVPAEKREGWLQAKVSTGAYDCLICNPNLVKTGLDLLDFPTIVFFQCGYSVYTLRQASRRSWRIGQDFPVRVFYLTYESCMQDKALSLMAQKMETSLAVEGELSDKGLAALAESENSILYELAKSLTGNTSTKSVKDAWADYRQKEMSVTLALDDKPVVTQEETIVTTTTTLTSPNGTKAQVQTQYVIRGKVQIVPEGAIAIVNGHRFVFRAGVIYWNDRKVGQYDRKGEGNINSKPIRLFRPENETHYVLAELKAA